jgi:phosphoserine aminotransferase
MRNVFIFNPGPSVLPEPVLESTSKAVLNFAGTGMSIMEVSHRSKQFDALLIETVDLLKKVMEIPDNYKILFLQGGASLQFAMIPINLLAAGKVADYVDTGYFATRAIKEAKLIGKVNVAASTKDLSYTRLPHPQSSSSPRMRPTATSPPTTPSTAPSGRPSPIRAMCRSWQTCRRTSCPGRST